MPSQLVNVSERVWRATVRYPGSTGHCHTRARYLNAGAMYFARSRSRCGPDTRWEYIVWKSPNPPQSYRTYPNTLNAALGASRQSSSHLTCDSIAELRTPPDALSIGLVRIRHPLRRRYPLTMPGIAPHKAPRRSLLPPCPTHSTRPSHSFRTIATDTCFLCNPYCSGVTTQTTTRGLVFCYYDYILTRPWHRRECARAGRAPRPGCP